MEETVTPYDRVRAAYKFFSPRGKEMDDRPFQVQIINNLALLPRSGLYMGVGTGKTFVSVVIALFKMLTNQIDVVVVAMPPILIIGWYRFLSRIQPALSILMYRGNPKKRLELNCRGHQFVLLSLDILKRDYDRIRRQLHGLRIFLIVDEATSIKNVASDNHDAVRDMVLDGADVSLLTGTPLSTPQDAYAYIKLIAPSIYRNLTHFENIHVVDRDFNDRPCEWSNLELLQENMKVNSVRVQRREVQKDCPPVDYLPMHYELAPAHYKLYKMLAEEQLIPLADGGKIDALTEQALYYAMQQIVINWSYFSQDERCVAKGLELAEEVLEELNGRKLIVVGNYRMTNRTLLQRWQKKHNALAMFGDISKSRQEKNKDLFAYEDKYKLMIIQPTSAGYGIDDWQFVCSDMLFLEMPNVPRHFHQCVARIDRDGQEEPVNVRVATALRTIQVKLLKDCMAKDELVGRVQPNIKDLRAALYGEE